jgi:hypothetical protein
MKVAMAPLLEAACERRWQEVRQELASAVMPDSAIPAVCDPWAGTSFNGLRLRDEGQLAQVRACWGPKTIHAFIWPQDRTASDVLYRRTQAMLEDLESRIQGAQRAQAREELRQLSRADGGTLGEQEDRQRFFALCRLQRRVALADPLLDFSRVFFTGFANTRFVSWAFQACDAIPWGMTIDARGGLYEVTGYDGPVAEVVDVLSGRPLQNGRHAGHALSNRDPCWRGEAIFNFFDLDFDASRIVFGWSASGVSLGARGRDRRDKNWTASGAGGRHVDAPFHLYALDLAGKAGPRQLTDGWYNDCQPCWLADGDVVFVSDRRHTMERCGSTMSGRTLHRMAPDGGQLRTLSYHETDERFPCVDHDGALIYSRWDYIDRPLDVAHNLWHCAPDGSDPRALHGNNPGAPVQSERVCRPVPGRPGLYVGLGAGHHAVNAGRLLVIDNNHPDRRPGNFRYFWPGTTHTGDGNGTDNGTLIRPIYGTAAARPRPVFKALSGNSFVDPLPLSEDRVLVGEESEIYLVDCFRNKVLLFDAASVLGWLPVRCPTPVRARPRPPVLTPRYPFPPPKQIERPATIAVMNVYERDQPWRTRKGYEGQPRITHLRVVQVLGKPWPASGGLNQPRIGWSDGGIARVILGTVPVEDDGSAYFLAPVNRELYFQALDAQGVVLQSMRSGTYVHPGEHLRCIGCHEEKHKPYAPLKAPLALRRPPSALAPDVGGVTPLNYTALVKKPVFDRKCLGCHQAKQKGPDFAYDSLRKHVVVLSASWLGTSGKGQTGVGQPYGALASGLFDHLWPGHHGVKLSDEERRRVFLWLDNNVLQIGGAYIPYKELVDRELQGIPSTPILDFDPRNPQGLEDLGSRLYLTPAERIIAVCTREARESLPKDYLLRLDELYDDPAVVARLRGQNDPDAVAGFLDHQVPQYRFEAARRLAQLKAVGQRPRLASRIEQEPFPIVLAETVQALDALSRNGQGTRLFLEHAAKDGFNVFWLSVCEFLPDRSGLTRIGLEILTKAADGAESERLRQFLTFQLAFAGAAAMP